MSTEHEHQAHVIDGIELHELGDFIEPPVIWRFGPTDHVILTTAGKTRVDHWVRNHADMDYPGVGITENYVQAVELHLTERTYRFQLTRATELGFETLFVATGWLPMRYRFPFEPGAVL